MVSLLKRVLEGFGYPVGIYEDAARTVVWHEMNGLDGLEELRLALPELDSETVFLLVSGKNTGGIPSMKKNVRNNGITEDVSA